MCGLPNAVVVDPRWKLAGLGGAETDLEVAAAADRPWGRIAVESVGATGGGAPIATGGGVLAPVGPWLGRTRLWQSVGWKWVTLWKVDRIGLAEAADLLGVSTVVLEGRAALDPRAAAWWLSNTEAGTPSTSAGLAREDGCPGVVEHAAWPWLGPEGPEGLTSTVVVGVVGVAAGPRVWAWDAIVTVRGDARGWGGVGGLGPKSVCDGRTIRGRSSRPEEYCCCCCCCCCCC
mmetsp:Transcript_95051/g.198691  ORF Transcript_95051/g.198691 Transcript_95051/m.198691 type:complete len:232 (+) Transcript_95051:108-803(+)